MGLGVDRVMTEGSLYDRELGALALKQARGDAVEAIFLLRAYRTTLPRFGTTAPIDTTTCRYAGGFPPRLKICLAAKSSALHTITHTACWTSNLLVMHLSPMKRRREPTMTGHTRILRALKQTQSTRST